MSRHSIITGLVATGLMFFGAAAMADPQGWHDGHGAHGWRGDGWERGGPHADRDAGFDYAQVVGVEPLRTRVRVTVPRQECYPQTRYEDDDRHYDGRDRTVTPTLLGGLLGAAVGNQIGQGDGRRAATVVGAVIGAGLGHAAAAEQVRRAYAPDDWQPRAYTVERCATRYEERWEERVDGYRVTYDYHGRRGVTELPYVPGDHIRVRVDVRPEWEG